MKRFIGFLHKMERFIVTVQRLAGHEKTDGVD